MAKNEMKALIKRGNKIHKRLIDLQESIDDIACPIRAAKARLDIGKLQAEFNQIFDKVFLIKKGA